MRISDWSSDVCSSDLADHQASRWIVEPFHLLDCCLISDGGVCIILTSAERAKDMKQKPVLISGMGQGYTTRNLGREDWWYLPHQKNALDRSEEHTSELQSLMRISNAVFCLKKKKK